VYTALPTAVPQPGAGTAAKGMVSGRSSGPIDVISCERFLSESLRANISQIERPLLSVAGIRWPVHYVKVFFSGEVDDLCLQLYPNSTSDGVCPQVPWQCCQKRLATDANRSHSGRWNMSSFCASCTSPHRLNALAFPGCGIHRS
jgi:hypothetical protein